MNEKLLRAIWKSQGFDQKGIPFEEFQNDIQNPKLQEAIYKSAGFESRGIKFNEFQADLGFDTTSAEIPVVSIPEVPVQEQPAAQPIGLPVGESTQSFGVTDSSDTGFIPQERSTFDLVKEGLDSDDPLLQQEIAERLESERTTGSFLNDTGQALESASLGLVESAMKLPDLIVELSAIPTSLAQYYAATKLFEKTPEQALELNRAFTEKIKEELGTNYLKDNDFTKFLEDRQEKLNSEIEQFDDNILSQLFSGEQENIDNGLRQLGIGFVQQIPQLAAMVLTGGGSRGLGTIGALAASSKFDELQENTPEEVQRNAGVAMLSGLIEAVSEKATLGIFSRNFAPIVEKFGPEKAADVAGELAGNWFTRILRKMGIAGDAIEEIQSEVIALASTNALDKFSGVDPERGIFDGWENTVAIAGAFGAGISTLGKGLRTVLTENKEQVENIIKPKQDGNQEENVLDLREEEEESTTSSATPTTTTPVKQKILVDFDDTLFDRSTNQLTPLGEEIKSKLDSGELTQDDVQILTAREATPENIEFIQQLTGIQNIQGGLTPEGKAQAASQVEGDKIFIDNNPDNIAAVSAAGVPTQSVNQNVRVQPDKPTQEVRVEPDTLQQGGLKDTVDLPKGNKLVDNKTNSVKAGKHFVFDETSYDVKDSNGGQLGTIHVSDRGDHYQISNVKLGSEKTGLGTDIYTTLISNLDKPLRSDTALTPAAKGLWNSLVRKGLAKEIENGQYESISPTATKTSPTKEGQTITRGNTTYTFTNNQWRTPAGRVASNQPALDALFSQEISPSAEAVETPSTTLNKQVSEVETALNDAADQIQAVLADRGVSESLANSKNKFLTEGVDKLEGGKKKVAKTLGEAILSNRPPQILVDKLGKPFFKTLRENAQKRRDLSSELSKSLRDARKKPQEPSGATISEKTTPNPTQEKSAPTEPPTASQTPKTRQNKKALRDYVAELPDGRLKTALQGALDSGKIFPSWTVRVLVSPAIEEETKMSILGDPSAQTEVIPASQARAVANEFLSDVSTVEDMAQAFQTIQTTYTENSVAQSPVIAWEFTAAEILARMAEDAGQFDLSGKIQSWVGIAANNAGRYNSRLNTNTDPDTRVFILKSEAFVQMQEKLSEVQPSGKTARKELNEVRTAAQKTIKDNIGRIKTVSSIGQSDTSTSALRGREMGRSKTLIDKGRKIRQDAIKKLRDESKKRLSSIPIDLLLEAAVDIAVGYYYEFAGNLIKARAEFRKAINTDPFDKAGITLEEFWRRATSDTAFDEKIKLADKELTIAELSKKTNSNVSNFVRELIRVAGLNIKERTKFHLKSNNKDYVFIKGKWYLAGKNEQFDLNDSQSSSITAQYVNENLDGLKKALLANIDNVSLQDMKAALDSAKRAIFPTEETRVQKRLKINELEDIVAALSGENIGLSNSRKLLRFGLESVAESVEKAVENFYTKKTNLAEFSEYLTAATGLSGPKMDLVRNNVFNEVERLIRAENQDQLEALMGKGKSLQNLFDLIKNGVLKDEFGFQTAFGKKYGYATFTQEDMAQLSSLFEEYEAADNTLDQSRVLQKFSKLFDKKVKAEDNVLVKIGEFVEDMVYKNYLSSPRTFENTILGGAVQTARNIFVDTAVLTGRLKFRLLGKAWSELLKGFLVGGYRAWDIIANSGEVDLSVLDDPRLSRRSVLDEIVYKTYQQYVNDIRKDPSFKNVTKEVLLAGFKTAIGTWVRASKGVLAGDAIIRGGSQRWNEVNEFYYNNMFGRGSTHAQVMNKLNESLGKFSDIGVRVENEIIQRFGDGSGLTKIQAAKRASQVKKYRIIRTADLESVNADAKIFTAAAQQAKDDAFMLKPKGYVGALFNVPLDIATLGLAQLSKKAKDSGSKGLYGTTFVVAGAAKYLMFPFLKLGGNLLNAAISLSPLGFLTASQANVYGIKAGGSIGATESRIPTEREKSNRRWLAGTMSLVMIATAMSLFDWEEDEEGNIILIPNLDANVRITGAGVPSYNKEKFTIDEGFQEYSVQAKVGNRWITFIDYSKIPLGFALAPFGKIHDDYVLTLDKSKKGVPLEDVLFTSLQANVAYALSIASVTEELGTIVNFLEQMRIAEGGIDETDARKISSENLSAEFAWKKRLSPLFPGGNFLGFIDEQYRAVAEIPLKEGENWVEKASQRYWLWNASLNKEKTDPLGYAIVPDINIPLIPKGINNYIQKALRGGEKTVPEVWQVIRQHPDVQEPNYYYSVTEFSDAKGDYAENLSGEIRSRIERVQRTILRDRLIGKLDAMKAASSEELEKLIVAERTASIADAKVQIFKEVLADKYLTTSTTWEGIKSHMRKQGVKIVGDEVKKN